MKKFIISSAVALGLATSVQAQDFNLQIENLANNVYESFSGVVLVSDENCEVPDYTDITLHYYGNPADSTFGPNYDNFSYTVEEPTIAKTNTGYFDADGNPVIEESIEWAEVTKTCHVYGVARLSDDGGNPVVYNSRSIWDDNSKRLYLYDTEIWLGHSDTETVFSYAELVLNDGKFNLVTLEQ